MSCHPHGFQPTLPPGVKPRRTLRNVIIFAAAGLVVLAFALKAAGVTSGNSAPVPGQSVTYVVTGSPATVTYGPAGSDLGGSVPMSVRAQLGDAAYYAINAQLQGSGRVQCEIIIRGTVISQAIATSAYGIANCEITPNPLTGTWQNANSG